MGMIILSLPTQAKDKPLPKVLLIGDSISIGYTPHVVKIMKGKALVKHHPGNAKFTSNGLRHLKGWIGTTQWDVIHFNWGLWDLSYRRPRNADKGKLPKEIGKILIPLPEYEKNLDELVKRLKATKAKLIWAHTTKVPPKTPDRILGEDDKYNAAAARVMKRHGIPINDLHALTKAFPANLYVRPGDVHFKREGYQKIAKQVVAHILAVLKAK